jgi:hypothetical protein
MEVSQLRHLKEVEAELARLKRMYADLALEHHALKDYVALKLNLPRRGKLRLPDRIREPLEVPMHANHTWWRESNPRPKALDAR